MANKRVDRLSFARFCVEVLKLSLTPAWRVLLAVTIDGVQPGRLEGEEREIARRLFGDVDEIDPRLRRVLIWRLGRASGKTTIAAALAIYCVWTSELPPGRGHVPVAFVVSPTKPIAKIAVGVARGLVRDTALESYVQGEDTEGFALRRPDGRTVEVRCVAASKGGANLRGRDVVVLVLDEAEFFESEDGAAVTDSDQIDAAMPRLVGFVLCISTPWPTENFTATAFDRNFGRPTDAVVALGPSSFMRPTPKLEQDLARERARDPENASREYDCISTARGGTRLFDADSVRSAIDDARSLVVSAPQGAKVAAGGDVAFERDSSAITIVAASEKDIVELLEFDEVRPTKGTPLAPGYVIRDRFAPTMTRHGVKEIMLDAFYRQSAIEHLTACKLSMVDAPGGAQGKYDTYMHLRALFRAGQMRLPNAPRLITQLRAVTATPMPGGRTKISSPRKAGSGHGDIISALVLACWMASGGKRFSGQGLLDWMRQQVAGAEPPKADMRPVLLKVPDWVRGSTYVSRGGRSYRVVDGELSAHPEDVEDMTTVGFVAA